MKLKTIIVAGLMLLTGSTHASSLEEKAIPEETSVVAEAGDFKITRTVNRVDYLRNGNRVASLLTVKETVGKFPETTRRLLQLNVSQKTWLEIDLGDRASWRKYGPEAVTVEACAGSLTVLEPVSGYFEHVFLTPEVKLLDGKDRDAMKGAFAEGTKLHSTPL